MALFTMALLHINLKFWFFKDNLVPKNLNKYVKVEMKSSIVLVCFSISTLGKKWAQSYLCRIIL